MALSDTWVSLQKVKVNHVQISNTLIDAVLLVVQKQLSKQLQRCIDAHCTYEQIGTLITMSERRYIETRHCYTDIIAVAVSNAGMHPRALRACCHLVTSALYHINQRRRRGRPCSAFFTPVTCYLVMTHFAQPIVRHFFNFFCKHFVDCRSSD